METNWTDLLTLVMSILVLFATIVVAVSTKN